MKKTRAILSMLALGACCLSCARQEDSLQDMMNPSLGYVEKSIKDFSMVWHEGKLYAYHSTFLSRDEDYFRTFRSRTWDSESSGARTAASESIVSHVQGECFDPSTGRWEPLPIDYSGVDEGWRGMASPSITAYRGQYAMVYNSWGNLPDKPNALFYRLSADGVQWSEQRRLAPDLIKDWAIDGNLIDFAGRVVLFWKTRGQESVTRAAFADAAEGPFDLIPAVEGFKDGEVTFALREGVSGPKWFENTNIYRIDGEWRLLAVHLKIPYLFRMQGTGEDLQDWLRWVDGYPIEIDRQPWNGFVPSNGPEIVPAQRPGEPHYIFFGGKNGCFRSEFIGRGWYKLGAARSYDLENWESLPAAPHLRLEMQTMDQYRGGKHERFELNGPTSYLIEVKVVVDPSSGGTLAAVRLYANRKELVPESVEGDRIRFFLEPGLQSLLAEGVLEDGRTIWTPQPLVLRLDW